MPLLLALSTGGGCADANPPEDAVEAETAARDHATSAATTSTTRLKLFPTLFGAALDTPRMTPHMMLIGLGSSTEDIGFD
jgi:hypothetical protein